MRSKLQVFYRESKENPAVIKFAVTGTVNGVAVRAETVQIHTGLHFVNRAGWIDLSFVEGRNTMVRADGSGRALSSEARRAVNMAVLDQIRLTTWREEGNVYPASLERAEFTSFEEA